MPRSVRLSVPPGPARHAAPRPARHTAPRPGYQSCATADPSAHGRKSAAVGRGTYRLAVQ